MKKIIIVLIILAILAGLGLIIAISINQYVKSSSQKKIIEGKIELKDIDAILILGCQVKPDGSLSMMLQDRLDKGIELYKSDAAPKVIVSGDHGEEHYDETNAMKKYMIENGVPSEDIFMDHAGFATYDSMYRAKNIFGVKRCIVVTQEYHLYRAIYIGNALGMETYGVAAIKTNYNGQTARNFREFLARNKDFIKCIFKPQSTYLGDTIPVSGNGDVTND